MSSGGGTLLPVLERDIDSQWGGSYTKEPLKLRLGAESGLYRRGHRRISQTSIGPLIKHKTTPSRRRSGKADIRMRRRYRQTQYSIPSVPISLQRLLDLLREKGEDDYGMVDPTQFAFKTAIEFVLNAESMLGRDVKSSPVVDSEGGIRVTWRSGDRQVKLICPATPSGIIYVYESSPMGSSVHNQNVTFAALAGRLSWLLHGDESEKPTE